jgi:D-glycero-beta-D-manno-heptose 1-phosphate adenylyltransferase
MNLKNPKLFSLAGACSFRGTLKRKHKKVVLTNGVFDLLHPGHLSYLQKAGELGELFIALNSDKSVRALKGKHRPILGEKERAYALGQLHKVAAIFIFRRERLTQEILKLKPDIYVKAGDYTLQTLNPLERAALEKVGAKIIFLPFLKGFSTTQLIARIQAAGSV